MTVASPTSGGAGWRLFALSFTALFLELMVIRWVPSEVRMVAYYANLLLISSFLGLGVGALVSSRGWNLFRLFPLLFAADIVLLLWLGNDLLPSGAGEFRFGATQGSFRGHLCLLLVFFANAAMFAPLGEAVGRQFARLPALRAYSWDLAGSLAGTLAFGLFSLLSFSPLIGLTAVMLVVLLLGERRPSGWSVAAGVAAIGAVWLASGHREIFWSPYYYITVDESYLVTENPPGGTFRQYVADRPASAPPAALKTMRDPPIYTLRVNQDFYQMHGTVDLSRYTVAGWRYDMIAAMYEQYRLPYRLIGRPERVLVLGAGGGMDVETALLNGAGHVDAVEIDPTIPRISNRLSASAPYLDPRVTLHVGDGRAFLQRTTGQFDLVAFGYLDSQALFSYGANVRLDGYIYTVESFRQAYRHVREGGVMAVWFFGGREWLMRKLAHMVTEATGSEPLVYMNHGALAIIAPKGATAHPASRTVDKWTLVAAGKGSIALATDDWPYLYLERRGIPTDYAIVIGLLAALSVIAVGTLRGRGFGSADGHFLFLGWGFLLLQAKGIGDCSLYFGGTWLVTTMVITGVLLMVLLANWTALRFLRGFNPWLYAPLFLTLLALLLVPRETILAQSFGFRLGWTLLAVPLPIFFAGLIFSTTFRTARNPSALFGANLIGATLGGFSEYLGMWTGSQALGYLVLTAYAASLLCMRRGFQGPPK
ncbi:MAG: speE 2 [Verrucomicrobia bacterium]|nr:speE 2 [Verrucomicrobiota bacterium]